MALNIPRALNALRALAHRTAGRRPGVTAPRAGARDLDIRPAATEEEVQAIRALLAEQVPHPSFVPLPEALPRRHHRLHRELIGAWRHRDLVGAAFIGPDEQEADGIARLGLDDASRLPRRGAAAGRRRPAARGRDAGALHLAGAPRA